jgi:hypothetical protein
VGARGGHRSCGGALQSIPVPNSQSHLFSLANLLESAEKRHSATPPPPPPESVRNDSGLIDLIAINNRAREEIAQAAATPTPVPMTLPTGVAPPRAMSSHASGPDFLALDTERRQKRLVYGAIAGAVALVAIAIMIAFSGSPQPPPAAAVQAAIATAAPLPPPPAPPAAPAAVAAPEPVAPAASETTATSTPAKKAKKKHSKSKGPKMTKVASGGT